MTAMPTPTLADPAALRSVYAEEGEPLLLAIVEPGQSKEVRHLVESLGAFAKDGVRPRLVIYGGSSAMLLEDGGSGPPHVQFLETWARPLLPAVLGVVDAVIPLGTRSQKLISELRDAGATIPKVVDADDLLSTQKMGRSLMPASDRVGAVTTTGRFILQNSWGIGDELLLSGVAREIVRAYPSTELWIRSRFGFEFPKFVRRDAAPDDARAIDVIYQNASLYAPRAHSPFPRHLVQQMLDKFALDTGLKVRARDVRPELDFRAPPKRMGNCVIVHSRPNPRLPSKDWGVSRWRRVTEILQTNGVRIRQVGGSEEPLLGNVEDLRGVSPGKLPDIFAESTAVVCVVGFLMHLAEATRTPAVVIYGGREHPAIDGYPDQRHLSSGPLSCRGRWGCHLAPDLDCSYGLKCMEDITPEAVAREVLRVIAGERNQ